MFSAEEIVLSAGNPFIFASSFSAVKKFENEVALTLDNLCHFALGGVGGRQLLDKRLCCLQGREGEGERD